MNSGILENPFAVLSPESLGSDQAVQLFVREFSEYDKIIGNSHIFLNGARGTGKSMIFRFMQPDCQAKIGSGRLSELQFLSVYLPIKGTDLRITELERLENNHASIYINEHLLIVKVLVAITAALRSAENYAEANFRESLHQWFNDEFLSRVTRAGWNGASDNRQVITEGHNPVAAMSAAVSHINDELARYIRLIAFSSDAIPYNGPLFSYIDFLWPVVHSLRGVKGMPNAPIFLNVDDADNLSPTQVTVLNTWVSTRSTQDLCLKISTQLNYKHFGTVSGQKIETPHDYAEVNISDIYTSNKDNYRKGLEKIIQKRLSLVDIEVAPAKFFPPNEEQERKIKEEEERLISEHSVSGKGYRPRDDAIRYARPNYMRTLAGMSKSSHTYSYAGFEQLVHISSGVVRHFLDAAFRMYAEETSRRPGSKPSFISPDIQNRVVVELSQEFLENGLALSTRHDPTDSKSEERQQKLINLVYNLGALFRAALVGTSSERRVFSVAFTDRPVRDIVEVFDLGVQYGYFHRGTIGNKEGTGRTLLYVLTRRLAPAFKLDPNGFAGHRFLTNDVLREAMKDPKALVRKLPTNRSGRKMDERMLQLPGFEE